MMVWDRIWLCTAVLLMISACGGGGSLETSEAPDDPAPTAVLFEPSLALWYANHELGDLTEWWRDQSREAVFNTGEARVSLTTEARRSGQYALKHEVWGIDRRETATRIFRWAEGLTEGYYSCWFMFPELPRVNDWLEIFQFKKKSESSNDPTWFVEIKNKTRGTVLTLTKWEQQWDIPPNVQLGDPLQAGRWFHLEAFYKDGERNGILRIWQDGQLIWDLERIETRGIDPLIQWSVNVYGDDVNPGNLVMYVDDCAIAHTRLGP